MPDYKAPLRDMRFVLNEVLDLDGHYAKLGLEEVNSELLNAFLEEGAKFAENELSPLNRSGDEEGCGFENGVVTTPKGFKEAYAKYVEGGWPAMGGDPEFGGQGLPGSSSIAISEMTGTANWSWSMYPGLSHGAVATIEAHGTDEQKQTYLPKLTSGEWTGTMCLTEAHCGSDLGLLKTKAEPQADGSYKITGTKIFISAGEHDMADNIVHIVLARLPDAPKGTKGISLFIVPKYLPGKIGESNGVVCGSLEKKMGIKASATCVMNFDEATGFMIGEENKGLECMFTFMNSARIGTACQGIAHAELAYQGSLPYAKERRSMRALSGKKDPDAVADALIHHGDVRRMLLKQKAIAEGGRAMIYFAAQYADNMISGMLEDDQEKYDRWDSELGFLTPILKGFLTEKGLEVANDAMQIFGGHGYIKEHGMEQIVRDARIATLYEGTTGIQALDLLGRKVLLSSRGKCVRDFSRKLVDFGTKNLRDGQLRPYAWKLLKIAAEWNYLTTRIMLNAAKDREMVGTASHDFLMYSGYAMMAYFWALQAKVAADKLEHGGAEPKEFYQAKLATAEFFFERMLPTAKGHAEAALKPTKSTMQLAPEHFSFDYE